MIKLLSQVSNALVLVVAADEGVSQQTKECIGICESLNLPVLVVINKIDLIPEEHEQRSLRIAQLSEELRSYVALDHAPIVPMSAVTGKEAQLQYNIYFSIALLLILCEL